MTPFGGLSFMINALVVLIGSACNFCIQRSAYLARKSLALKKLLAEQAQQKRAAYLSYLIMVTVFSIVFATTAGAIYYETQAPLRTTEVFTVVLNYR